MNHIKYFCNLIQSNPKNAKTPRDAEKRNITLGYYRGKWEGRGTAFSKTIVFNQSSPVENTHLPKPSKQLETKLLMERSTQKSMNHLEQIINRLWDSNKRQKRLFPQRKISQTTLKTWPITAFNKQTFVQEWENL